MADDYSDDKAWKDRLRQNWSSSKMDQQNLVRRWRKGLLMPGTSMGHNAYGAMRPKRILEVLS